VKANAGNANAGNANAAMISRRYLMSGAFRMSVMASRFAALGRDRAFLYKR
jgi:hypothetical protein